MTDRATSAPLASVDAVPIQPGVGILSILQHIEYEPWFALAEFVDNSLQSYLTHRTAILDVDPTATQLRVFIERDYSSSQHEVLTIRDNAAGIFAHEYKRAFRPAEVPADRSGLSEFGMGMKTAAMWFSPHWCVTSTALGEPVERTVDFQLNAILESKAESLPVTPRVARASSHYTIVTLRSLHHPPQKKTIAKIKSHLASIFRTFIRDGLLQLSFNGTLLTFEDPPILTAPHYQDEGGVPILWRKEIDFDFGGEHRIKGFAALRETGSTAEAGFALFRRKRLIEGSGDQTYRPQHIFGNSNSYAYQRLFGELSIEGFDVSHTKNGFRWGDDEDAFLELLRDELDAEPLRLLQQAEGHRARAGKRFDLDAKANEAVQHTAQVVEQNAAPVVERQEHEPPDSAPTPTGLVQPSTSYQRHLELDIDGTSWDVTIEIVNDASILEWITISDVVRANPNFQQRCLSIRMNVAHPFTERFIGPDAAALEPFLRIATAIALAETTARDGGVRNAGLLRDRINQYLREVLSKP